VRRLGRNDPHPRRQLTVGLEGERPQRSQWAISDVAALIDAHFGIDATAPPPLAATAAAG